MASERRNSGRERMRYGICLNDECEMCRNKTIQQIPMRKDFVCQNPDCSKELRECPPPKKQNKMPLYIAGALIALCVLGGGIYALSGGSDDKPTVTAADSVAHTAPIDTTVAASSTIKSDTVVVRDTIVQNNTTTISEKTSTKTVVNTVSTKPKSSTSGSVNLGYAKFVGPVSNGLPDGQGRMTFITSHQIDSRDVKARIADAGDYVIGEWKDGKLIHGKWYGSDNNVKGSIMIGL